MWFEFQRVHYTLDESTNTFSTVVFDSHRPMRYYQQSRGVESDDQLEEIRYLLGDNKFVFLLKSFLNNLQKKFKGNLVTCTSAIYVLDCKV